MDKLNKLSLPATIIIASIILGGFLYVSQVNKQRSIEKQQRLKLINETLERQARTEKENMEYIAKRKLDCLAIYKAESDKWKSGSVQSWNYIEPYVKKDDEGKENFLQLTIQEVRAKYEDTCEIIYKDKTGENFSKYY